MDPETDAEPVWSVYMIRRADAALYTGIATDIDRRIEEHRAGRGAKALRGRGPLELVARCEVGDRSTAQRVESSIKRLSKAEKEALVTANDGIRALATRMLRESDS